MRKKSRLWSYPFVLTLILTLLFSTLFLASEAFHQCEEERCTVCAVQKTWKGNDQSLLPVKAGFALHLPLMEEAKYIALSETRKPSTPISLKDRLDN